ncbi:hypothetical protein AKJ44_01860 [candidate division MSBL1 archaeon SCGC-AAA261F17]|uniref:Uncharacterized protein n=1 Tax=candidate division MSBL1 archaeon SCGC-AAA261F17 TaxID=1698274 RepID=A0A133V649_9EURY|nr:hypothetical protein AKJ44_01860 [candidate division MSBL1 archaeon SCGC-AAA261F17]
MGLSRAAMKLDNKWGYRRFSWIVFISLFFIVYGITGIPGLLLMFVCTGIGLMPVLFRSRRLNCMAVLLVPIFLNMAGFGPRIIEALGLVG